MKSFVVFVCSKTDHKYSNTKSYNFAMTTITQDWFETISTETQG